MRRLKVTFPINLNEKDEALRAEVYWEEFLNTSIENFEKAIIRALGECTYFPKPTELREFIRFEANTRYLESQNIEPNYQLEWMMPTEEGKALAKQYLGKIFEKIEADIIKPQLEGDAAKKFEEKRKIAKQKAKQFLR
jgi:hypothetical protein